MITPSTSHTTSISSSTITYTQPLPPLFSFQIYTSNYETWTRLYMFISKTQYWPVDKNLFLKPIQTQKEKKRCHFYLHPSPLDSIGTPTTITATISTNTATFIKSHRQFRNHDIHCTLNVLNRLYAFWSLPISKF